MKKRNIGGILLGAVVFVLFAAIFIFITTVIGGSLMGILGMEYDSFGSVFLFFVVYFIADLPVDLLVDAIPSALLAVGKIKGRAAENLIYAAIDIPANLIIILAVDLFMDSVRIPVPAALVFSAVLCLVNIALDETSDGGEPVRLYLWEQKKGAERGSRALLREALLLYCRDKLIPLNEENLAIETGPHGKPYAGKRVGDQILPRDDLFFSVSHTKNWWLCAVWNQPLGVDIEVSGRKISEGIADRFFSVEECQWLDQHGRSADNLLKLWVRKEAYVKYLGTGLSEKMCSFSVAGPEQPEFYEVVGGGEEASYCGDLFPERLEDEAGFPVPLTGAFCTEVRPSGLEIGFLQFEEEDERADKGGEDDGSEQDGEAGRKGAAAQRGEG